VDIDLNDTIKELEEEMLAAANNLEFEKAALLRDQIRELKRALDGPPSAKGTPVKPVSYAKSKKGAGAGKSRNGSRKVSDPI